MRLRFVGERGIAYIIQANSLLTTCNWGNLLSVRPEYVNETNGMYRLEVNPCALGQGQMFYCVIGR
ncbi:MAG: hypothetical protein WCK89_06365 [bacterium]